MKINSERQKLLEETISELNEKYNKRQRLLEETISEFKEKYKELNEKEIKNLVNTRINMNSIESNIKDLYEESIISYNKVLENYKDLAREFKIDSAFDISTLFTYMLWNGYYSVNKNHSYQTKGRIYLPGITSLNVIRGEGICKEYAELLANQLKMNGKKAMPLLCKVGDINFNYQPDIKRNSDRDSSIGIILRPLLKWLSNNFGNHAITLVDEDGELFAYDPTNIVGLNFTDENTASIINGTGDFELRKYMTLTEYSDSDYDLLYKKISSDQIEPVLTRKEFIFMTENMMEKIMSNISLLDDAYDNIHPELEVIDRQMDEIGMGSKVYRKAFRDVLNQNPTIK